MMKLLLQRTITMIMMIKITIIKLKKKQVTIFKLTLKWSVLMYHPRILPY
jgi:hypothetical protein